LKPKNVSVLKLTWDNFSNQYKVNKPGDQSGEYYRKEEIDELFEQLLELAEKLCDEVT